MALRRQWDVTSIVDKNKKNRAQAFLQSRMQEWKHLNTMSLTQLKKWIDGFGTTPNEANNFLRIQQGKYFDIYPNQRVAIASSGHFHTARKWMGQ
jgi:hypothetical protein